MKYSRKCASKRGMNNESHPKGWPERPRQVHRQREIELATKGIF
jgi:hypothetical protein